MTRRALRSIVEFDSATYWFVLAAVFLTIGIVGALGEWVFHWWEEPFDWLAPASLVLGFIAIGWGASGRDLRGLRKASTTEHRTLHGTQQQLVTGQDKMLAGQDKMLTAQEQMLTGQEKMLSGQDKLIAGQQEGNALLREMLATFRRT